MSFRTHILVAAVIALTILFIYRLVTRQILKPKYAMLWSVMAVGLLPLAVIPDLLVPISDLVGISYEPATILFASTVFLFVAIVHLSYELSRTEQRLQVLAEEMALLRARLEPSGALEED